MPQKASKRHRGSRVAQPIKGSLIDTGVERTPNVVQPPSLAALFPASMINVINTALKHTFTLAILLRAVLLIYAEWQDANFAVKYTDVDYKVFSDAAAAIVNGNSPFRRATYRYTPLLAYALVPNVGVPEWGIPAAPWFGKLLFVGADLAVGVLIRRVLLLRGMHIDMATRWSALYLFHPFSWTVSTRGNADGIVGALVLLSLYLAMQHRVVTSALVYGIAVHFKIYPIIYAPAFLVLFDRSTYRGIKTKPGPTKNTCPSFIRELLSPDRVTFGIVSGSVFLILGALFYFHFGYEFLYETYLYHLIRKDNRHNFSVYFYDLYLGFGGGNIGGVNSENVVGSHTLAFLPQFGVAIALALRFGKDLPFALATQTMAFVTFNKVCTAQYFLWYFCLLPLALPQTKIAGRWQGILITLLWFGCELHWLYWGYRLEFLGEAVFLQLWSASMLFFGANVLIIYFLVQNHIYAPLFKDGRIDLIYDRKDASKSSRGTGNETRVMRRSVRHRSRTPRSKTAKEK